MHQARGSASGESACPHCWVLVYPCPAPAAKAELGVAQSNAPSLNLWIHLGLDSCIAWAGQTLPPCPGSLKSIQEQGSK